MTAALDAVLEVDAPHCAHYVAFSIACCRVGVRSNSYDLLCRFADLWRPFHSPGNTRLPVDRRYTLLDLGPRGARTAPLVGTAAQAIARVWRGRFVLLTGDGERIIHAGEHPSEVIDFLDWHASTAALTGASASAVYHSAVLSYGARGLLLPAAAGSGKTTLAAALTCAGFGFLSDEAALVDVATRCVHAYPKRLAVKEPATLMRLLSLPPAAAEAALRQPGTVWHLDPTLLAPHCLRASTTVAAIVFPRYEPGGETVLTPLGRASAVLQLLRYGVSAPARPPAGIDVAAALVGAAACYRLTVGDLATAVRLLGALFEPDGAAAMRCRLMG